jgi:hypothetical protein
MSDALGTPVPVYFLHIPKTGGSSVRVWLASSFKDRLCPAGIADELVGMSANDLDRYQVFAGHFHSYLPQYLARKMVVFTILRDPVDRTRSHWHQVRRHSHHPYHERVRSQTFAEFVEDDRNRVMIEDYQARYLADLPIDMAALARNFCDADLARYALAEQLEQLSLTATKTFLATSAKAALGRMAAVGLTERLPEFLVQVAGILELPAPEATPQANVTGRDDSGVLPAATLARLREMTMLDQGLYDAARCGSIGGP